ncbi:MAG TPA: ABC transporter permease [Clostridia bacterium]|nr:ABC transporter permease [Clostridia bacterium]
MEHLGFTLNNLFALTVQLAIPIALAALGGTISERSGIINLGLEGMMLMGAFAGVLGVYVTGMPWFGVVFSIIAGGLVGGLHGLFSIRFKAQQAVSGVGINMMAAGLTPVLLKIIWKNEGMSSSVATVPTITIPLLNKIPFIGGIFDKQSPYLFYAIAAVTIAWIIIYKTKIGLRLRAIGDYPRSAQTAGINVNKYKYIAVIISGCLAGLGGSYLSISQNNLFVVDMVSGRGFMGLAANIFGGWNPIGSLLASLVFAFGQSIRFYLLEVNIPDKFIQMIPYVVTLMVLLAVGKKSKEPEALGKID